MKNNWKAITLGSLASLFFILSPWLIGQLSKTFIFSEYLHLDAPRITANVKRKFMLPLSLVLPYSYLTFIVIPWFFALAFAFAFLYRRTWKLHRPILILAVSLYILLYSFPDVLLELDDDRHSISEGHVANGSLYAAKRVNFRGENFTTYSFPGYLMGRTFAHENLRNTIINAYAQCAEILTETDFVLGEIGHKNGGSFLPHRSHQNGMSVDFMTPYLKYEKSFYKKNIFNLWGYNLEFDDEGNTDKYQIDFEAVAHHLYAVKKAAQKNGLVIQKVIFDPVLRRKLTQTKVWSKIRHLPFTKKRMVWRHDDHYHVDFAVNRKAKLD